MDWFPIVFITFKVVVLGIGMFFAVKWHYDQDKKAKKRLGWRAAVTMAGIFLLSLLIVLVVTFTLVRALNLDLGFTL